MAKLTANTVVYDPNGDLVLLRAGEEAPKWAKDILGEHLFVKSDTKKSVSELVSATVADGNAGRNLPTGNEEPDEEPEVDMPKRGAAATVWRAFAKAAGINISDDLSRNEIIEAVEAAGFDVP